MRRIRLRGGAAPVSAEAGQAAVELVALLPAILLAGALAWQLALTGHAAWMAAHAARVAARAEAVGRDPERAARTALPKHLEHGLDVGRRREGGVRVSLRVPLVSRRWRAPVRIAAASSLGGTRRSTGGGR